LKQEFMITIFEKPCYLIIALFKNYDISHVY
jgi:hypothetical protein